MARSNKGAVLEREICRKLGLWWTGGKRDDIFWRTAGSGARATNRKRTDKNTFGQYGDIQATDPIGQPLLDLFSIEVKNGYPFATASNVFDIMDNGRCYLLEFIAQARRARRHSGTKWWMLIHKRDRRETVVSIPVEAWVCLFRPTDPHMEVKTDTTHFVQVLLRTFFSVVSPEAIRFFGGKYGLSCISKKRRKGKS